MSVSIIATIQRPPVILDRMGTTEAAVATIDEAAASGARLLVFPETYIPG
jgi:nitrilase